MVEEGLTAMLSTRTLKLTAWSACAVTTGLALGRVVLAIVEPEAAQAYSDPEARGDPAVYVALTALVLMAFGLLGAIVASRQPRNAVGWLLVLISLSLGVVVVSDRLYWHVALTSGATAGIAPYVAWLASWSWIPAIVFAFAVFPSLFPTGRPLSRRWRPLLWIALVAGAVTFAGTAFVPGTIPAYPVVNPLGIDSGAVKIIGDAGFTILIPTALASIVSLIVRFRRSHGTERQQLKWVAAAAALLPVAFVGFGVSGDAGFAILLLGLLIVAAAVAIAMLRYRLYDIDVVINRALVYGALTATLAGTYLGSVLLLQLVLSSFTEGSGLAVAGSTLAVARVFQPARRRIQAGVDRRFFRHKYDAARTLERFSGRVRDEVDLDALAAELRAVVGETMQPAHVSLWLRADAAEPR
ncbi:MAG: hypothetical protein M3N04_09025 [Actinomycetota bacterium]|nr:hypothetical protein [Actinomycetota bacterium]